MRLIFNPTLDDVTVDSDKFGDHPETHTLKAGQMQRFEDHIAELIKEKLVNRMLWKDYPANHNRDARIKELNEQVEIQNGDTEDN